MPTPILGIPEVAPTQTDKTTTMNDAMVAIEAATQDQLTVDMSGGDVTLTALQYTRASLFTCSGLTADRNLIVPLTKRVFAVRNVSSFAVTVKGATGATVTVAGGDGAIIICDGTDCTQFGSGGPGVAGPTGLAGGGVSIGYTFSTTTTNADPGSGNLRLNAATQNAATGVYVSLNADDATDWTAVLDTLDASSSTAKGQLRLFKRDDASKWIVGSLSSRTTHTGYREFAISVTGASDSNPFADGDRLILAFTRTGDVGATGPAGATGATGPTGPIGPSTTVVAGAGLDGGTITSAGTVSLAQIAAGDVLANPGTAAAVPSATTVSALLDAGIAMTQGDILFRSGTAWAALSPGTADQVLKTGGAAANPSWSDPLWNAGMVAAVGSGLILSGGTLAATSQPYTVGVFNPGTMSNGQMLLLHEFPAAVSFPANFGASTSGGSSKAGCSVNATSATAIGIAKCAAASDPTVSGNFSNVGTISIGAGGHAGTISTGGSVVAFAAGDFLRLLGPGTADATLANFFATLVGDR